MMWKGLGIITNTESPIVVVLSYVLSFYLFFKGNQLIVKGERKRRKEGEDVRVFVCLLISCFVCFFFFIFG